MFEAVEAGLDRPKAGGGKGGSKGLEEKTVIGFTDRSTAGDGSEEP